MGAGEELEEDGGVHGQVSSDTSAPEGGEDADGCECRGACCHEAECSRCTNGEIEGPFPPKDITSRLSAQSSLGLQSVRTPKSPEHGANQQADVLCQ